MCGSAAHLVDHVLPDVPVRQWVLTTPFRVRRVLALRPDALTMANRLFVEEIARWQKQKATERGTLGGETGSVTFVQRFDSTLGSFVHFHVVALDGVFTRQDGPDVVFHEGPAPSREDIATVAARVEKRLMRWLRRRKLVDDRPIEEQSNEAPELSPLESCMQMSLFGGVFVRLDEDGVPLAEPDDDRFRTRGKSAKSTSAAEVGGFNIHAGVTIRKGYREGLERLCRYGARPPFSLERISLLPDGRVAYRLRRPRRNGATHLVLTPVHFLARIAALVPPPRFPLTRLAGVLAPSSSWRAAVVSHGHASPGAPVLKRKKAKKKKGGASPAFANDTPAPAQAPTRVDPPASARTSLGNGIVQPVYARIDWASLLRRVYLVDVLSCPCGGRRRIVADISEREAIVAILSHLGIPTEPPPIARARDPSFEAA